MQKSQKVLVVGATGGTGRAVVEQLLRAGHQVTAFSRHADRLRGLSDRLTTVNGDSTRPEDLDRAVRGQDAVIVTLGISENPLRVRLFGAGHTPLNVRSAGTRALIGAMRRHGVRRLVVQSSFGAGDTRSKLRLVERLLFRLLLQPQIADTEVQEREVRQSGMNWVLARPVHLTDAESDGMPFASTDSQVRAWTVSRKGVARFLAGAVQAPDYVGRSVALSGAEVA